MTRNDLVAGVRQWWALDRAETIAFAAYMAVLAAVAVFAGAALWVPVVFVALGIAVPSLSAIVRRARQNAAARELTEWLESFADAD